MHFRIGDNCDQLAVTEKTRLGCAIDHDLGERFVEYRYDVWGKILSITGSMAGTLGTLNPLTYRGYVYDHETGLYYLQSRYYNPEWGRFLNADALVSTGGLLGNNMFAYCNNNPVILSDPRGMAAAINIDDERTELMPKQKVPIGGLCLVLLGLAGLSSIDRVDEKVTDIIVIINLKEAKKQKKEQETKLQIPTANSQPSYQYWEAYHVGNNVIIGKGLTIQEASLRVPAGFSIMCANQEAAMCIVLINCYREYVGPEIHNNNDSKTGDYYYHYHPNRHSHTHIWFYS